MHEKLYFDKKNHWSLSQGQNCCIHYVVCTIALAGKFKIWSKNIGSVLKRCEYDVRSTKKNLGSIGGSLEEPQPKHVHWGRLSDLLIA